MNSSSVSSFFSRDGFLKRQARTRKRSAQDELCPSTSSLNQPLPMIVEEDEPRVSNTSTRRSPSPVHYTPSTSPSRSQMLGVKSKRRHANLTVSDIRLAKAGFIQGDAAFTEENPALLSSPRPAPRPPVTATPSPEPSPDPFSLRFPEGSMKFPHPPIPTPSSISMFDYYRAGSESPTPSMSSGSSSNSPECRYIGLPTTPTSSDDGFPSYYTSPTPSPNPPRVSIRPLIITKHNTSVTIEDSSPSATLPEPAKTCGHHSLPHSTFPIDDHSDSEESDSEWYTRELSQILTLCSPLPPNFPMKSRPDSICVPLTPTATAATPSPGFPSLQLDPAFPTRRRSRVSIPSYPPPPVPTAPIKALMGSSKPPGHRSSALTVVPPPRPPPRSSIPADCVIVDDTFTFSDDSSSAFSFSLYDTSPIANSHFENSPSSSYSQQSFRSPNPSPFPASFPSTPCSFPTSTEEEFDLPNDIQFDVNSPHEAIPPLSLPTSPIDLDADITSRFDQLRNESYSPYLMSGASPTLPGVIDDTRELRSRWSSSTLGSIREEHSRRGGLGLAASAKLRAYFGSPSVKSKSLSSRARRSSVVPMSPPPPSPMSPTKRLRHSRRESDVMMIGYGVHPQGQGHELRRRGSVTSSVGSDDSASSSSSSGLRRKPIPVEMFLRSAA